MMEPQMNADERTHGGPDDGRPLVYLACPYSHQTRQVRFERFLAANRAAAMLMVLHGESVFSPISHSHPICEAVVDDETGESQSWGYWERFDRAILSICHKLYVLPMPGWKESRGVQAEIVIARQMGIQIEILPSVFCTGTLAVEPASDETRATNDTSSL